MLYFIGIEGGASNSHGVLVDERGTVLSLVEDAPSTNFWLIGMEETQKRLYELVQQLKKKANLKDIQIECLGVCLSGVKDTPDNQPFANGLHQKYPDIASNCVSRNDTIGSLYTATAKGGVVLIAGTGSNCTLLNEDETTINCGGWGHLLGDQGAAFKLSQRAVKAVLNHQDGLKVSKFSIDNVKQTITEHFYIEGDCINDLLTHSYEKFDKTYFAALCKKVANLANKGDAFALHLFKLNGRDLARHINAIYPHVKKRLLESKGGLTIVCVGSLFKSWPLLQQGFLDELNPNLKRFSLYRLKVSSALGAAFLAAKYINQHLPIHSGQNLHLILAHNKQ